MLDNLREKMSWEKVLILASVLMAFIGIGMLAYTFGYGSQAHAAAMDELQSKVAALQQEYDAQTKVEATSVEDAKTTLVSAKSIGEKVAEYQNQYPGLLNNPDGLDEDAIVKMGKDLAALFGEDESAARSSWISQVDIPIEWVFCSGYTIAKADSSATVPCVWMCYDASKGGDRRLVAYTLADYNAESQVFVNVDTHMTEYGSEHMVATTGQPTKSDGADAVDDPEKVNGDDAPVSGDAELSEEELARLNDAAPEGE